MKLTKPQMILLRDLKYGPERVSMPYKPAERLIALGYVKSEKSVFGTALLYLTESGRRALTEDTSNE